MKGKKFGILRNNCYDKSKVVYLYYKKLLNN
jgi:hypothetical protein